MSDDKSFRADVAERHRAYAANFAAKAAHVKDWDAPTPVPEWTARDVVRHLVEWSRELFGTSTGVTFGQVGSVDADPVGVWRQHTEQMQMLLDSKAVEDLEMDTPSFGRQPLLKAISDFYVPDIFMHTWDLAKASGQESGLDQATCHSMLTRMEQQESSLRASGQFGHRQPVPANAPSDDQLAAFIGRDPHWEPPTE